MMLDYICGITFHNKKDGGLRNLAEIALPQKSFVTTSGFKVPGRFIFLVGFNETVSLNWCNRATAKPCQ